MRAKKKLRAARTVIILLLIVAAAGIRTTANVVEWDVVAGGGSKITGGSNTLWGSINQTATLRTTGATNVTTVGYIINIPLDAAVDCRNGGSACSSSFYGAATSLTFRNTAGCASPACAFNKNATQYYRYLWQTSGTCNSVSLNSGSTWSDSNTYCPGGTCTKLGTSMTLAGTTDNDYYLCVRSYNGGLIGTDQVLGPYVYDITAPTVNAPVPANTDYSSTWVDGTFDISSSVSDARSMLKDSSCEYRCSGDGGLCDGTWRTASDNWSGTGTANGTCSITNVTCTTNGASISMQMRVQDNAGNTGTSSSVNRTCDTAAPTAGTITPSNTDYGSAYVDATFDLGATFSDGTGSGVASCQYCKSTDGTCDTEWAAATWGASCSQTGIICTDGQTLTLNMRATDNVTNVGAGTAVTRTCDASAPTCSTFSISESAANVYTDGSTTVWYNNTSSGGNYSVTVTNAADARSGVNKVNFPSPDSLTGCGDDSTPAYTCSFSFTTSTTHSASVTETVTDNVGNTGTCAYTLTRDVNAPTGSTISYTDGYRTSTSVAITLTNGTDAASGIAARYLDRREANLADGTGACGSYGSWGSVATNPALSYTDNTVVSGKCYQYRYRQADNVGNESSVCTDGSGCAAPNTAKIDTAAPNTFTSCSSITLREQSGGTVLTWGASYDYEAPSKPYMQWSSPGDLPAGTNSGVEGYYVYFGTNASADPFVSGSYTTNAYLTNTIDMTSGTSYYLLIKPRDRAGNVGASSTACQYKYSTGGYLTITQIDTDGTSYGGDLGSSDNPEGVLRPNNTDFEIIQVKVVDENDQVITTGNIASKNVTITLSNLGTTGGYIASTNMTSPGCTPGVGVTTCSGNLVSGQAWIKIKANGTEDPDAIIATPSASGLSGLGGRTQIVQILVRDDPFFDLPINDVTTAFAQPDSGQTIVSPVWNHAGSSVAFMSYLGGSWNIYKKTYSGSWGAAVRLTSNNMQVAPGNTFTWSGDDSYIVFTSNNLTDYEPELYAVASSGADNAKTQATLESENKRLTNKTYSASDRRKWTDSDWSNTTCGNGYQDRIVASMTRIQGAPKGSDLWTLSGTKTGGLYLEGAAGDVATVTRLTNIPGQKYLLQPRWSHDCTKIAFVVVDSPAAGSKTSIYIMNLSDAGWGSTVSAFPVTTLSAAGMHKIYDCTDSSCTLGSAVFPAFTADDNSLMFSVNKNAAIDIRALQNNDIVTAFFTGQNFDNYVEFIDDQPTTTPQLVGQSNNNEFGITQCAGASCPDNGDGNPFTYITQKTGTTTGDLRYATLGNESTITQNGGLMFINGGIAAVIPPGAVNSETKLQVTSPTVLGAGSCGGYSADCSDLLVSTGEARDFFPDGVIFNEDIQLIFHYCDTDADGYLDVRQNAACSGGTGGSSGIDENSLYVYYWCDANGDATLRHCTQNQWQQLNGGIDPDNNMITVVTNHFSIYDLKTLTRAGAQAPPAYVPIYLSSPHTYPNPWRRSESPDGLVHFNIGGDSTWTTENDVAGTILSVNIDIYDVRGKLVKSISQAHAGVQNTQASLTDANGGFTIATWDARNNGGRPVASGVYLYHMVVTDGYTTRGITGKLAIVK